MHFLSRAGPHGFLDKLVVELLRKVRLPEAWQMDVERLVKNMDVVRKIENRRSGNR